MAVDCLSRESQAVHLIFTALSTSLQNSEVSVPEVGRVSKRFSIEVRKLTRKRVAGMPSNIASSVSAPLPSWAQAEMVESMLFCAENKDDHEAWLSFIATATIPLLWPGGGRGGGMEDEEGVGVGDGSKSSSNCSSSSSSSSITAPRALQYAFWLQQQHQQLTEEDSHKTRSRMRSGGHRQI